MAPPVTAIAAPCAAKADAGADCEVEPQAPPPPRDVETARQAQRYIAPSAYDNWFLDADSPELLATIPPAVLMQRSPIHAGNDFDGLTAEQKQAVLMADIRRTAYPFDKLPKDGDGGLAMSPGGIFAGLGGGFQATFDGTRQELREPHDKPFHPRGSTGTMDFVPAPGAPRFTGMFSSGFHGMIRLSHATENKEPGIAIMGLIDGRRSVSMQAIFDLEAKGGEDFFDRALTNVIPQPKNVGTALGTAFFGLVVGANPLVRPVDSFAAVDSHGNPVDKEKAPYQLIFEPADYHLPSGDKRDFRRQFADIPPGTTLYRVYARATAPVQPMKTVLTGRGSFRVPNGPPILAPKVLIGEVKLTSELVPSAMGDHQLNFNHKR